jgi:crossover junction endodeoxyribonuclease RuvC
MVACGAVTAPTRGTFPQKLLAIHDGLADLLGRHQPDCVAIENLFYARNAHSALTLGHVRGVVMLVAMRAGMPIAEYSPAEVKRAVVGYGRAEKHQVQRMIKLLLGLKTAPSPYDVSDALAVAVCHSHRLAATRPLATSVVRSSVQPPGPRSWRQYRPGGG